MRTRLAVAVIVAGFVVPLSAPPPAQSAVSPAAWPQPRFDGTTAVGLSAVQGEVAVRLRSGVSRDVASSVARGGYSIVSRRPLLGWLVLRTSDTPSRVRDVLMAHGDVVSTEPVFLREATGAVVPNDPGYSRFQQSYLRNTRFPLAWGTVHTSPSTTLAVLDTGVDGSQPDLAGRVAVGYDEIAGHGGANTDPNGHGTLVAGVATAGTNNRDGGAGAAWGGRVLPVRVLDENGRGNDLQVSQGIVDATNAGARVINMSLGGPANSAMLSDAVDYAASKGVVMVAAAGNTARNAPIYPAAYSQVIAVSATNELGLFAEFSTSGRWIDVAAPGVRIYGPAPCRNGVCPFVTGTGTSVAAPLVAAVAMLARTRYPSDTPRQTMLRIVHHAQDRGAPGIDDEYGWGLLDAAAAVGAAPRRAFVPTGGHDGLEPSDAPAQATPLVLDAPRSATIAPEGDTDWYSISVTAPTTEIIEVSGMVTQIDIYDSDLAHVYSYAAGSVPPLHLETRLTPGTWYVKVSAATSALSDYTISLTTGTGPGYPIGINSYKSPFGCQTAGDAPNVAVDDVNRDGRPDVITANGESSSPQASNLVQVFDPAADGSCRLIQQVRYRAIAGLPHFALTRMRSVDIDGDGRRDLLVVGNRTAWAVLNHAGRFQAAERLDTGGSYVQDAYVADVNRDGHPDLIVASNRGIDIYYQGPTPSHTHLTDSGSLLIAVGDLTGDGRIDVINDQMVIYEQTTTGTFVARPPLDFASFPRGRVDGLTVGDVNGDGRTDIVSLHNGNVPDAAIQVHPQRNDSTYGSAVNYPVDDSPSSPLIADLNGDGRSDLVVAHSNYVVGYLLQQPASPTFGAESFTPEGSYSNYAASNAFAVADVTGDGRRDIVSATGFSFINVFARAEVASPPLVDSAPRNLTRNVASNVTIRCVFGSAVLSSSVTSHTVALRDLSTGQTVAAIRHIDATHKIVSVVPQYRLLSGHTYGVTITSIRDSSGAINTVIDTFRFTIA